MVWLCSSDPPLSFCAMCYPIGIFYPNLQGKKSIFFSNFWFFFIESNHSNILLNNSKTNQYFDLKFGEDVKKYLHFTPFLVDFQNFNLEGHRSQKTICKFKFTLPPYGQKIFTVAIQQSADFNQLISISWLNNMTLFLVSMYVNTTYCFHWGLSSVKISFIHIFIQLFVIISVSYTHLTLPTIYSV